MTTVFESIKDLHTEMLDAQAIPMVLIGGATQFPSLSCDRVSEQYEGKTQKIVHYIVEKGYKDPAVLIPRAIAENSSFLQGIAGELKQAGLSLPEDKILIFDTTRGFTAQPNPYIDAEELVMRRFKEGFRCQTLICEHDYPAVGAIRGLLKLGYSIPGDIKVISAATCSVEGSLPMKLTTLNVHQDLQASLAAQLLIRRIEGYTGSLEVHYLSADMVIGETA
jgi:DNA-binding LacI/PurR family transcriptional regulator